MGAEGERRPAERAALDRVLGSGRRLGPERRRAGAWSADRDPKTASELVARVVAEEGWELDVSLGSLAAGWADIVGAKVAEHCFPEAFAAGELTLRADSPAWATQIRLLAGQLLGAVERAVGAGIVKDIKVVGPAPTSRRGRHIERRRPKPQPNTQPKTQPKTSAPETDLFS